VRLLRRCGCGRRMQPGAVSTRSASSWCREPVQQLDPQSCEHSAVAQRARRRPEARLVDFDDEDCLRRPASFRRLSCKCSTRAVRGWTCVSPPICSTARTSDAFGFTTCRSPRAPVRRADAFAPSGKASRPAAPRRSERPRKAKAAPVPSHRRTARVLCCGPD